MAGRKGIRGRRDASSPNPKQGEPEPFREADSEVPVEWIASKEPRGDLEDPDPEHQYKPDKREKSDERENHRQHEDNGDE